MKVRRDVVLLLISVGLAVVIGGAFATGSPWWFPRRADQSRAARQTRRASESHASSAQSPPLLNADASCATIQSTEVLFAPRAVFVDGTGQIETGGAAVEAKLLPTGVYMPIVRSRVGDLVELSIRLNNTGYVAVQNVHVRVDITQPHRGCWKATAVATSEASVRDKVTLGSVDILTPTDSETKLDFVPGSGELLDWHDHRLANLTSTILGAGESLPYDIPGGTAWYADLLLRVSR